MNKLAWTMAVLLASTVAAALTSRLMARIYQEIKHRPPPEMPQWARLLFVPFRGKIAHTVQPG